MRQNHDYEGLPDPQRDVLLPAPAQSPPKPRGRSRDAMRKAALPAPVILVAAAAWCSRAETAGTAAALPGAPLRTSLAAGLRQATGPPAS